MYPSGEEAPGGAPDRSVSPDDLVARVAEASADPIRRPPSWIHRRVESIEFLGESRCHRRVSIDFTVPRDIGPVHDLAYVPLALLTTNRSLVRFDLRDEAGSALSLLERAQHDEICARIVVGLARAAVSRLTNPQLDERLEQELGRRVIEHSRSPRRPAPSDAERCAGLPARGCR